MNSLLSGLQPVDVRLEPFPHIVVRDAIDDTLSDQLIAQYPSLQTLTKGKEYASNRRFSYGAHDVLANPDLSPLWKEFVQTHVSQAFLDDFMRLFGGTIRSTYPELEGRLRALETWRAGVRDQDNFDNADVLLDAQICTNTPVVGTPTSVRRAHLDDADKLFVGLFYLRAPDDDSTGGDLELSRFKDKRYGFRGRFIDDKYVEVVETIKYEKNVLVLFLNSVDALHGVTIRSQTQSPRNLFNLVGEVKDPLFDLEEYQEGKLDALLSAPLRGLRSLRKVVSTR